MEVDADYFFEVWRNNIHLTHGSSTSPIGVIYYGLMYHVFRFPTNNESRFEYYTNDFPLEKVIYNFFRDVIDIGVKDADKLTMIEFDYYGSFFRLNIALSCNNGSASPIPTLYPYITQYRNDDAFIPDKYRKAMTNLTNGYTTTTNTTVLKTMTDVKFYEIKINPYDLIKVYDCPRK